MMPRCPKVLSSKGSRRDCARGGWSCFSRRRWWRDARAYRFGGTKSLRASQMRAPDARTPPCGPSSDWQLRWMWTWPISLLKTDAKATTRKARPTSRPSRSALLEVVQAPRPSSENGLLGLLALRPDIWWSRNAERPGRPRGDCFWGPNVDV